MSRAPTTIESPALSFQSDIMLGSPGHIRNNKYYLFDGNVIFLVENHLFRIHRYFLIRESMVFRDMLSMPAPIGSELEGLTDEKPIHLPQVSSNDFENFLWVWYKSEFEYNATAAKWGSILHLSHRWDFPSVKWLAIRHLEPIVSPVDRAVWAIDYDVENDWHIKAYASLGTREEPLSDEEGARLGLQISLKLARLRERILKRRHSNQLRPAHMMYSSRPGSPEPQLIPIVPGLNIGYNDDDIEDTKAEFDL